MNKNAKGAWRWAGPVWAAVFLLVCVPRVDARDYPGLLVLRHAGTTLGIKLNAGGRAMLLERGESGNMLYADPALFAAEPPAMVPDAPWQPFNGHITWIGPQERFWARQNLLPQRQTSDWPPDPYIIYGRFVVAEQAADRVLLEGPESPISGVRLRKEFRIAADGSVLHTVTAYNIRKEAVSMNLWSNTRVRGGQLCFVKVPNRHLRVVDDIWDPYINRPLDWSITQGWFHFNPPAQLPAQTKEAVSKAYLPCNQGLIVAFSEGWTLRKTFTPVKTSEVFPGQYPVELYQRVSRIPADSIAELEFYGPARTLAPGESISLQECWAVLPGPAAPSEEACLQWLHQNIGR